jgi:putative ABC transport system permease protein
MRRVLLRLINVLRPHRAERDLSREIASHLALLEDEYRRRGMTPEQARQAAKRSFGAVERAKDLHRDARSFVWLDDARTDLRHALRGFTKTPGFTTVAVITLALGIGASTAIFSVIDAVLLRSLPFHDAGRLVRLWETDPPDRPRRSDRRPVSPVAYRDWGQERELFADVAATTSGSNQNLTLTGSGTPTKILTDRVSGSFLRVLGVQPLLGRNFLPQEEQSGYDRVVLLSYDLWQTQFGSDHQIVGRSITLDASGHTVIGVLPRGFQSPDRLTSPNKTFLLRPLPFGALTEEDRGRHILYVIARLMPDATLEQAQARITGIARQVETGDPEMKGWGARVVALSDDVVMNVRPTLLALFAAVGCLMLIACANVANLMLARVTSQSGELAIRAALGAGRSRLARQLLAQSLLLAVCGGAIGIFVAVWLMDLLLTLAPTNIPRLSEASINAPVLAFALGMSVVTSLFFGTLPALQASTPDVGTSLKQVGRTTSLGGARMRHALVVAEVAIAMTLVIEAGLLINTFRRIQSVELGMRSDNVLAMEIAPPASKYTEPAARVAFFQQVLEKAGALPGVRSAAVISHVPFGGSSGGGFVIEGRTPSDPREWDAEFRSASGEYFRTMGIPVLAGRTLTDQDTANTLLVAVINQTMARRFWPDESPIGKRIRRRSGPVNLPWLTIVGIVGDVRHLGPIQDVFLEVYIPYTQPSWASSGAPFPFPRELVVRTESDPVNTVSSLQQQVWSIDKDQPVTAVRTLESLSRGSVSRQRFTMLLFATFGFIGLVLAAVGIHGVLSYSVTQRRHEIGIRAALGAHPRRMMAMVVGEGMSLVAVGTVIGIVVALALTRFTSTLLFGVTPTDTATFLSVAVMFAGVACFACYFSAAKAARVDPLLALKYE